MPTNHLHRLTVEDYTRGGKQNHDTETYDPFPLMAIGLEFIESSEPGFARKWHGAWLRQGSDRETVAKTLCALADAVLHDGIGAEGLEDRNLRLVNSDQFMTLLGMFQGHKAATARPVGLDHSEVENIIRQEPRNVITAASLRPLLGKDMLLHAWFPQSTATGGNAVLTYSGQILRLSPSGRHYQFAPDTGGADYGWLEVAKIHEVEVLEEPVTEEPEGPLDFRGRVRLEYSELNDKLCKLTDFFDTETFKSLPEDERRRLIAQHDHMSGYAGVLADRIAAWTSEAVRG